MLSKVLAYFIKYVETYNLTEDEIRSLAEAFGVTEFLSEIEESAKEHDKTAECNRCCGGGYLWFGIRVDAVCRGGVV